MEDRRSRFRAFIRDLDPVADPKGAFDAGHYVPSPWSVGRRVATRLELDPGSQHLIAGGIGSGKTTELIYIQTALEKVDDVRVVRFDVPAHHRLKLIKPGVLVALVALEAAHRLDDHLEDRVECRALARKLRLHALGDDVEEHPYEEEDPHEEPDSVWSPGVLVSPEQDDPVRELHAALETALEILGVRMIMLFDGLDRLSAVKDFDLLVSQDIPVLKSLDIGAVVVGPQHLRFGAYAAVRELFDEFHLHGAANLGDPTGQQFMRSVLRARATSALLPDETCDMLIEASGGLLRDLISMARHAGEEAYLSGSESILLDHAARAIDRLGRTLLMGLTSGMVDALLAAASQQVLLRKAGKTQVSPWLNNFTPATDVDVELLIHRLIIEVPTAPPTYRIHPAIELFLPGLRKSA